MAQTTGPEECERAGGRAALGRRRAFDLLWKRHEVGNASSLEKLSGIKAASEIIQGYGSFTEDWLLVDENISAKAMTSLNLGPHKATFLVLSTFLLTSVHRAFPFSSKQLTIFQEET